jgi:nucleoside-diphosphate-sugar epimerase
VINRGKLVIGASGFLGSHVTRRLVADGNDVRVMLRRTSSTRGIDDLAVERAMATSSTTRRCARPWQVATYGPGDWQPTPHGSLIARVAAGRFPFHLGFSSEVVGIEDATRAMVFAPDRGRVGERYIVSDQYTSTREVHEIAAEAVGMRTAELMSHSIRKAARFFAATSVTASAW